MAKAESIPTTKESNTALVASGLFDLEEGFLRVRDLTYAMRMAASSVEIAKEATNAIEALTSTILDEINALIAERTRLCHLASGHEEGADGQA